MSKAHLIREALANFAGRFGPLQTILAKVIDVNEGEFTCTIDDEGIKMHEVKLRPVINGNKSFTLIPKVGSWVLMARIEDDENWTVLQCDEIEKFSIKADDAVFEYDGSKFKIEKGAFSLHDILSDLVTEVIAIYAPKNVGNLTAIKTKISQLFN